ncbi:MAG: biofilm PGA synthesis N-glycosyltransferase PgaC [Parvicella sp.]|jgi:biofilm PGA synthesis N-glycosyltransferase PgaC
METIFWISLTIVFYTFIGYAVIISILSGFKRKKKKLPKLSNEDLPEVTLLIAAYNEEDIIEAKIKNCQNLEYPKDKLNIVFVTDGSNDRTNTIIEAYDEINLEFRPERKGKVAATNRVMPSITTPITIFSDANVMLNKEAINAIVNPFQSNQVGAVSGEKIVTSRDQDGASAHGEGIYWQLESYLKRKDAQWNSLVGSAGELFAIRTHLFSATEEDTLIEDFVMTMRLAASGYKVEYEPKAIAVESASASIEEETKRKVRISAGGIQAIVKLVRVLNVFKYGKLTFQYVSHRVLRWTLMPLALIGLFLSSYIISDQNLFYELSFTAQFIFYHFTFLGYLIRNKKTSYKLLHIPYYFVYMHICVVQGWFKYFSGTQKVTWEKSKRVAQG